jgi:hypothetical protein
MTPERWKQIDAIFRDAVRLGGEQRRRYLEQACRGDTELRGQVESLLAHDRSGAPGGSVLNSPNMGAARGVLPPTASPVAGPGAQGTANSRFTVDPVVGWVVCVKGPDRFRDYRICPGRNRIGRDNAMEICVPGDGRISRSAHTVITYDPRHNDFRLSLGPECDIVFLNGEFLEGATQLRPRDLIEIGDTGLQFVPLCGEKFQWK